MPGKSKFQISRSLDEKIKRIISGSHDSDSEFFRLDSAYILGFNYGNVTNCVALTTNYQLHHAVFPVVGLVFFKSSPSDDHIKSSLRSVKEYSSSPNGLGIFKADKNEHLFLIYNVDKETNEIEKRIFNFTKGTFVRRRRLRLNILNDPHCPRQVHRGSEDLFPLGDADSLSSAEDDHVDHLIFFIHGVGGVCDVRFRSCVEVVADFRKMANNLLSTSSTPTSRAPTPSNVQLAQHLKKGLFRKQSTESTTSKSSDSECTPETSAASPPVSMKRIECLPVSWHSCTRRQTGLNDQLNLIALSSVPKMRHFLNKVIIDALLYCSGPVYNQTIINNVGDEINRLYTLFMEKHPNFTGSVSLAGHSLGSVILFDLLANQIPDNQINNDLPTRDSNENTTHLFNSRQNCRNVSHNHHEFTPTQTNSCMEYQNLEQLLKDMDLTQYSELFNKEHIDINTLLLLTDWDMKELNLPLGARLKLGTYINFQRVSMIPIGPEARYSSDNNTQQQQRPFCSESSSKTRHNNFISENMNTGQFLIKYPQLKFKPRCFFAFGSPMAMFLNTRGVKCISKGYKLPTCDRMFNIFHPYDPLAYRMEPLIEADFKAIDPVQVPHHKGGKRIHVQLRDIKHRLLGSLRSTWTSFTSYNSQPESYESSRSPSVDSNIPEDKAKWTKSQSTSVEVEVESPAAKSRDSLNVGRLNGGRRLDYVLQEKPIELFNEYIFAFTSHANYWQNEDSAAFILNEIYRVDGTVRVSTASTSEAPVTAEG